jgi:hypothetical protein
MSLLAPASGPLRNLVNTERTIAMEEVSEEPAELVQRVAALDIGKATLVACARMPHDAKPGRRRQEVRTFATTTRSLPGAGGLAGWPGRDPGGDGVHVHLLEAAVLPARGAV